MNLLKSHPNEEGTYAIIDLETKEVLETFRLKSTAITDLATYSSEHRKTLEVRKVK
ncbi:hypothetical protein LCGC14_1948220 [marine sediment metagenome]|uniref:Uncharacterized protein n=1 Tax=marine sediment metagenome TaxID=412755 RepID=A0A0F9IF95_9ZZZZ